MRAGMAVGFISSLSTMLFLMRPVRHVYDRTGWDGAWTGSGSRYIARLWATHSRSATERLFVLDLPNNKPKSVVLPQRP